MLTLTHITSIECAEGILRSGSIHGAAYPGESHEAYPHFLHSGYSCNYNSYAANPEISLDFHCELPEKHCSIEPPSPGMLNVHLINGEFWQCTIHPDTQSPLRFIGWKELGSASISTASKSLFDAAATEKKPIRVVWHPKSEEAVQRVRRKQPLHPQCCILACLFGKRSPS